MLHNSLRWSGRALIGFSALVICCILFYQLYWTAVISQRGNESFDFKDTPEEQSCFQGIGAASSAAASSGLSPIPNVVHFIWGIRDTDFIFLHYLVVRSALLSIRPTAIKIHYLSINEDNMWYRELKGFVTFVKHDLQSEFGDKIGTNWQTAHLADVLRLDILNREGGIYLDMDVISLRSFDNIRSNTNSVVLGRQGGDRRSLPNAVILARSGSSFMERWIASYDTFSTTEWNYHSTIVPLQFAREYPGDVCSLSPTVFFWPTWTKNHVQYMHKPLSQSEAREVEQILAQNGGSLYHNQLAYHAWSQMTWNKYLRHLTPQSVMNKDTRFNIMVRRFLDDDDNNYSSADHSFKVRSI